jgi:hypothetical protein
LEGALLRATPDRQKTASTSTLPDHLIIIRTKIILNRLPTRQERHRRGDTHADGTLIKPACPNCTQPIENHLHAIADCPRLQNHAAQLAFDINNTIRTTSSTLIKKGNRDAAWLQKQLQYMHDHTFVLKQDGRSRIRTNTGEQQSPEKGRTEWGHRRAETFSTRHYSAVGYVTNH